MNSLYALFIICRWSWHLEHDWKHSTTWIHGIWESLQVQEISLSILLLFLEVTRTLASYDITQIRLHKVVCFFLEQCCCLFHRFFSGTKYTNSFCINVFFPLHFEEKDGWCILSSCWLFIPTISLGTGKWVIMFSEFSEMIVSVYVCAQFCVLNWATPWFCEDLNTTYRFVFMSGLFFSLINFYFMRIWSNDD